MVRWRVPRVLAVSILMTIIVMAMVLLLAYLGSALNELTRTLPQYRNSIMTPLQAIEPLLQRVGIDVSVDQLAHYIDPNAAMTLLTNLLTQLSNAMSSIFIAADGAVYAARSATIARKISANDGASG